MRPSRRSRSFAVLVVLGATLAACGDEGDKLSAPAFTADLTATTEVATSPPSSDDVPSTSSPATSNTDAAPSTAPTSTAPATSVATTASQPSPTVPPSTQPVAATPTEDVAVSYVGAGEFASFIVAVWTGTNWAYPSWNEDGTPRDVGTAGSLSTTALGLQAPVGGAVLGDLDYYCYGDETSPSIELPLGVNVPAAWALSVTADWNIQPRPATVSLDPGVYAEAGQALVDGNQTAFAAEGVVTQAVDVDLQGDGANDAIYVVERRSDDLDGFGTEGDFSLVVAMYPDADGVVRHHVLFELYEHPDEQPGDVLAEVYGVADLNGDNVMEVVFWWQYWESYVLEVFAFDDSGELVAVAGGGCGS